MARKSKEEKRVEQLAHDAFRKFSSGRPINVLDIGKVLKVGEDAARAGQDVDAAVLAAFEKYKTT